MVSAQPKLKQTARYLNLIGELLLYGLLFAGSVAIFVMFAYISTPFDPYTISGYVSVPSVVCPSDTVTVEVRDKLEQQKNVLLKENSITIWSQFVGVDGIASFSELSYPVVVNPGEEWNTLPHGGHTKFARQAPSVPGEYILRSRVVAVGYVFGRFKRELTFPVDVNDRILIVLDDDEPACEGA